MTYSTRLALLLTTLLASKAPESDLGDSAPETLRDRLDPTLRQLLDLAEQFRLAPASGEATLAFEQNLQALLRELGRLTLQHTYDSLEPDDPQILPQHVLFDGTSYRRTQRKTPQHVWTLFGQIRLRRFGYRASRHDGLPTFFPLARSLGLIHGATPALASHAGRLFCGCGMTQSQTRERLRAECGVGWGVKKLRQFLAELTERLKPARLDCLKARLLELLAQAHRCEGKQTPVLSVGRDGITLGIRVKKGRIYEVATTATLSVYDRGGKRLGTVYLAHAPQPEQAGMSRELTQLIRGVLRDWPGALPRLCYVTDAGNSETGYYRKVLVVMRHPVTKERLAWIRVVDYYHASQRVWAMAEALFGKGQEATCWAVKMLKWLVKRGGINRVLHSANAHRWRLGLGGERQTRYAEGYNYLSRRMKYMRYGEYREQGLPIGSGVTEAGCKTVYTQRLKLSGMCWGAEASKEDGVGAQTVLELRVLLLSGVWDRAFLSMLRTSQVANCLTNELPSHNAEATAA